MADVPLLLTDAEDEQTLGETIIEMAERVKAINPAIPGARATYAFEMDGTIFQVIVTVRDVAKEPDHG